VAVKPMDDPYLGPIALAAREVVAEPVEEGVGFARLGRHRENACLLVDDEQVCIFMQQFEAAVFARFGRCLVFLRGVESDLDAIAGREPFPGLFKRTPP
jgi:hypothetical protein